MRDLTDLELARELAHARNERDAFAAGREPAVVQARLLALLHEQERRRHAPRLLIHVNVELTRDEKRGLDDAHARGSGAEYEATLEMIASRHIRSATKDDIVLAEEV